MPPGKFSGATPRDLVLSPENPQFFIPHIRQPRPPRVSARALLFFSDAAATRFATTSQARRVLRGLGERTAFARPSPDILLERFGGHPGPPKLGRPMQTPRVCMADGRRLLRRLLRSPNARRPSWPAEAWSANANAKGLHGRRTPPAAALLCRALRRPSWPAEAWSADANAKGLHGRPTRPPAASSCRAQIAAAILAGRSLVGRCKRQGFAWPTDAASCRVFVPRPNRGGHPGPPKLCRPMQTPRVCMADRRGLLPCRLCIGATQPVGGTRRSRCTLPAPRDAPWRWRPQRQSPPTTSMSPTGDACSTGSPAILARRSATVQRSRSEARAGVGVLCLHRRTHHGDGGRNGKVRRRRACLRPATPA
jgi:hypothetical protein